MVVDPFLLAYNFYNGLCIIFSLGVMSLGIAPFLCAMKNTAPGRTWSPVRR